MSTYAILGASGHCGSAIVELALRDPANKVHLYCRNSTKLIQTLPGITENKQVTVFEGSITDAKLIGDCVRGCNAVFHTVTTNTNVPGYDAGQIVTKHIITALRELKEKGEQIPRVVLLSSSILDAHLRRNVPKAFVWLMSRAGSNFYNDLKASEEMLRAEDSWISSIFIKPGGLSPDPRQRGHALDLDREETFISYLDLAGGMIEAASDPNNQYSMKNVAVVNTNGSARIPWALGICIVTGYLRYMFPWTHPYLPSY